MTEAELDEIERVDLMTGLAISNYEVNEKGIAADARLLYVTQFARGQDESVNADPGGGEFLRALEAGNLVAAAAGSSILLEPPLMSLLSMGVQSSEESIKSGYQFGQRILSAPSLTLVGYTRSGEHALGTAGYGERIQELFLKGDALMRRADLGCEPASLSMNGTALVTRERFSRDIWTDWYPNVLRTRGYICRKINADPTAKDTINQVAVWPSPRTSKEVQKQVGLMGLTGTVTGAHDPIIVTTFKDLSKYPGYAGNDGAWRLLEKLQDAIPQGWYFVLSGSTPGDPGGELKVAVGRKEGSEFRLALYRSP